LRSTSRDEGHVGLILPDGTIYEYPDWNTQLRPWLPSFSVPASFQLSTTSLGPIYGLPDGLTTGVYRVAAALTRPGTLEIVAFTATPYYVSSYEVPSLIAGITMSRFPIGTPDDLDPSAVGSFSSGGPEALEFIKNARNVLPSIDQCSFLPDANVIAVPEILITSHADAGESLTLSSEAGAAITLTKFGGFYGDFADSPASFYREGATYTLTIPGGADLGPGTASVVAPTQIVVTQPDFSQPALNSAEDLQLAWVGNGGVGEIAVDVVGGISPQSSLVCCRFADDGSAAIPSTILGQLRNVLAVGSAVSVLLSRSNSNLVSRGDLEGTGFFTSTLTDYGPTLQ
jgi:hypothetical protein